MKMWTILELIALAIIVLVFITEFLLPLIFNKPLFGSFRKLQKQDKASAKKDSSNDPLKEKISKAKEKVEEVKETQKEVTEHYKSAKDLKKESDNLL